LLLALLGFDAVLYGFHQMRLELRLRVFAKLRTWQRRSPEG
jgi:hypothetical protein